jgi:hypothetical protein
MQSQFPGEQFSTMVTLAWHEEVGPSPLSYVAGEFWSAGNVIMYSPERAAPVRKRRCDAQSESRSWRYPPPGRGDPVRSAGAAEQAADARDQRPMAHRIPGRRTAPALCHPPANATRRDCLGDRLGLAEAASGGRKREKSSMEGPCEAPSRRLAVSRKR